MTYLLDADTINYVLKEKGSARERLRETVAAGSAFIRCPVVHYQLTRCLKLKGASRLLRIYGELTSGWRNAELAAADWDLAADLWAERHRAGSPITDSDLLIAVTALQAGAVLVTNNERHFAGLGLTVENWAASGAPPL